MSARLTPPRPWPLDTAGKPKRRVAVPGNRGVYWRPDGMFEVGYRDADGRQRWRGPFETITAARAPASRRAGRGARRRAGVGESAAEVRRGGRSLARRAGRRAAAGDAGELPGARRAPSAAALGQPTHGRDRRHRRGAPGARAARRRARRVDDHRASCRAANRVFKFARRHCRWRGENPFELLERSERPKAERDAGAAHLRRRRARADARGVDGAVDDAVPARERSSAGRESELLGLWWEDLELRDVDARPRSASRTRSTATGQRVAAEDRGEQGDAAAAAGRRRGCCWSTRRARRRRPGRGRSCSPRGRAGRSASATCCGRSTRRRSAPATSEGRPTFPELFEHDERGQLVVDERRPLRAARRQAPRAAPAGLPRAPPRRGDGLRRRRGGARPAAAQELERHARRSTARTSGIAGASSCARAWKRGWKRSTAEGRSHQSRSSPPKWSICRRNERRPETQRPPAGIL